MQKPMRSNLPGLMLVGLVLSTIMLSCPAVPTSRAQSSSAANSQPQATPVTQQDPDAGLRQACADALDELKAARKLIAAQQVALDKDAELAGLQGQVEAGLKNLRELDAEEKQHLRDAIAAADKQVAALEAEVAVLKKQRMTFWKKAKWFIVGGVAGVAVCAVACK